MIFRRSAMVWMGGAALLSISAIDTLAVIGRHIGLPLHGSIELIQAAVLIAGGLALVAATAAGNHARVRLLLDRISPGRFLWVDRGASLLSALFFAALLAGASWLAVELWSSHELSELTGVSYRWLRAFCNLCLGMCVILFLRDTVKRSAN